MFGEHLIGGRPFARISEFAGEQWEKVCAPKGEKDNTLDTKNWTDVTVDEIPTTTCSGDNNGS